MTFALFIQWLAAGFLIATATFALLEVKSSALIPKSLFLWPLTTFGFGICAFILAWLKQGEADFWAFLTTGVAVAVCAAQALLVNIRRITRWPSGAVWLGLALAGLFYQWSDSYVIEPLFETFQARLAGFLWCAIGITKVVSEKSVSQEGGVPVWIQLLYVQAILIASSSV